MTSNPQQPRQTRPLVIALYVNAALLATVVLLLLGRDGGPPGILSAAYGQNQPPIGGGAGVFIVPAQLSTNTFGCYLMDIDAQTLSAYQFFPAERQLRLLASRNFRYDRRLGHYNTPNPSPEEVKQLVEQEQEATKTLQQATEHPAVEAPQKNE